MEIRHLRQTDDRFEISRIYEESWKFAYKGIVPQEYLDSIPAGRWASHLDREGIINIVIVENDMLVGTASYCKSRFSEFEGFGEIVSIYLLPEYIGKGYGTALMDFALKELAELGYRDIFLWVLEDNLRGRDFYESMDFELSGIYMEDDIGGKKLREVGYCYHIK